VLSVVGIILVIAGVVIIFFGDRQIPVRGGIVLRLFSMRQRSDEDALPQWSYRILFGAAVILGGVLVLLRASNIA
jgi:hypothetical protein